MPQVPYNPVPDVSPTTETTPGFRLDTPGAAFGTNVGEAMQHLGATVGTVGNEMFSRAIALQELHNQTEANEKYSDFVEQQGRLHYEFGAKLGKNAVDGLDPYIEQSRALRDQISGSMSNPAARRFFDTESRNVLARNINAAGSHAAEQNKVWQVQTNRAVNGANANAVHVDPRDPQLFQNSLDAVDKTVDNEVANGFLSEGPIAEYERGIRKSNVWLERVRGTAKIAPTEAKMVMEAGIRDGGLRGDDIDKARDFVNRQFTLVGSRNVSHNISTGQDIGLGEGKVEMSRAKQAICTIESGCNYGAVTDSRTSLGRALGKYQIMEGELQGDLRNAGLPSMTPEQFLANHDAQERVFESKFGGLMDKHGSFNDAASAWLTGLPLDKAGNRADRFGTTASIYVKKANAELAKSASLGEKEALGRRRADEQNPDDPLYGNVVASRIRSDQIQVDQLNREKIRVATDTIDQAIYGMLPTQQGRMPNSIEEVMAIPGIDKAIESLPDTKSRLAIPGQILKAIQERDLPYQKEEWKRLEGIRAEDPERYLSIKVSDVNLNGDQKVRMIQAQKALRKNPEADPNITAAIRTLKPEMDAIGLVKPGKNEDQTQWDQFTGELQDAIANEIRSSGGKPLRYEDYRTIGRRLLQNMNPNAQIPFLESLRTGKRTPYFTDTTPQYFFQQPATDEEMFDKRQRMIAESPGEPTPSDVEVRREIIRDRYNSLYGKGSKGNKLPAAKPTIAEAE